MIQRLIETLQALTAPADIQRERFPDSVVKADELVRDFDDALLLVRDCPQLMLTDAQLDALAEVDSALSAVSGHGHSELWTEDALQTSVEWQEVHRRARAALSALDAPMEDPGCSEQ